MQIARARVIPQACPVSQHAILGRRGERFDRRKRFQESQIVGDHRPDLSLLKHDFRQPYPVWVPVSLPGQVVPAVALLPRNQAIRELRHPLASHGAD